MKYKTPVGILSLFVMFTVLLTACSGSSAKTPMATQTPTTPPVPTREQISDVFLKSPGKYLSSAGYLELTDTPVLVNSPTECVRSITVWIYDEKGQLNGQNTGIAYIYGQYAIASSTLIPQFPDPDTIELPPPFPGMSEQDYKKAIEQLKEEMRRWKQFKIEPALAWGTTTEGTFRMQALEAIPIGDPALAKELREFGLAIFKRLPKDPSGRPVETPECSRYGMATGNSSALKTFDLLYVPGFFPDIDGTMIMAPTNASYMLPYPKKQAFYFQGSIMTIDLVSPIFAYDKASRKFVTVGIIIANGGQVETRGVAITVEYFLDLMKRVGIITVNSSP